MKPVKVGICGMGTVGGGTFDVLNRNASEIARRAGRRIQIEQVAMRRPNPAFDTTGIHVTSDIFEIATNPEIDIVIELIGGYETAFDLVMTAIQNGKHVVTANKALIAVHGNEIFAAAQEKNVMVAFEASVAGGIPIIKAIREGLSANKIDWLAGIINGTGNFILTEMRDKGRAFEDVLAEAQALGYAEADPTFDVEGIDAAHKLTILASIAFGIPLQFEKAYTEGISKITSQDVNYAEELGYRIKHLGISRRTAKGIELRVHPTMIPEKALLANVDGVMNAVLVDGDAVGQTLYYGAGAGAEPTASAVVADVVDVVRTLTADRDNRVPHLAFQPSELSDAEVLPVEQVESAYYLRLQAVERPGVMAHITRILGEKGINIEAVIQKPIRESQVPVILLTQRVVESTMNEALREIEALPDVVGEVTRIRVEQLAD
ncbi:MULTISPECIES: homoserine dehydrogenase [unclassified Marinobacterium]|uniref:homoserine dehydrogenase n=1 Tax=unclassified Marinobacterium TaxID=2644139 RepID=UPI00156A0C33|nr:Homoserine dehydrogenase [Marinobacterium sp. xm-g-48]NRP15454.1 Homoserine dehydrogenase [Marinobacterium sp. xm-a-152]NRP26456.1 Homoserine dehydrogenase [Marinobacterium sp. xm-d-420]NRP35761.1 Homoserine dehydrogenase [Marinobacterium sp. xm-d-579]NRP37466.1 Homoserine dehydrogenase [Marinobacterium sp. xm-a-121]NRP47511.1 Homoserine dehydrogenase [Marinobacterium sp. xm-d-543]NRP53558.1 Homoserine dehydrogenase [Marinobacterium sp. xm-v-242]NRP56706.1 Homoserine dehydrogenase [Marino